jgi:hypothetical protein
MTGAPLQDAILDAATLSQLLFDIGHAAVLVGIVIRPLGARRAGGLPPPSLEAAQHVLAEGTASVQLRYRFDDEEWWDTLLPVTGGVRLVRISHTRALAMGE